MTTTSSMADHAISSDQGVLFDLILQQVPPPKREMLSTSWSKDYLNRLTSLPARALQNEPSKLREEQLKVERDMSELAFKDYKAFILVKDCKEDVQSTFENLGQHLDHFHETIPQFASTLTNFSTNVADILQRQHVFNSILASHSQLLEVLEIPVLMETCVRNGYYNEALELAAHVQRLVIRYPGLKIIQEIDTKVSQGKEMMLVQLLAQLREPIKLPVALRIISFLRRIGSFTSQLQNVDHDEQQSRDRIGASTTTSTTSSSSFATASLLSSGSHSGMEDETPLRMLFLKSRGLYMTLQLTKVVLHKGDSFSYLKKYIDVTRECLFDIMTYYKSIFGTGADSNYHSDSFSSTTNGSPSKKSHHHHQGNAVQNLDFRLQKQHGWTTDNLLADFVTHRTQILLSILNTHIPQTHDTQALSSILTQLMYLGANMSKIGFDLRYLVTSLFEDAVIRVVGNAFQKGAIEFMDSLGGEGYSYPDWLLPTQWMLGGTGRVSSSSAASPTLSRTTMTGTGTGTGTGSPTTASSSGTSGSTMSPQTVLMDYPSLAYLTNSYLTALNSLRLLAPLSVAVPLRDILLDSLTRVNNALIEYDRFVFGERANSTILSVLGIKAHSSSAAAVATSPSTVESGMTAPATTTTNGNMAVKAHNLEGSALLNEHKTMDGFVIVYKRAVYDYILKCFDEGIYGGLVRELYGHTEDELIEAIHAEDSVVAAEETPPLDSGEEVCVEQGKDSVNIEEPPERVQLEVQTQEQDSENKIE
ncbi:conserved oligomeric Golgi complex component [Podila humilis]|nr:conserved oligomeric Golgi complex component [Podila humilis]